MRLGVNVPNFGPGTDPGVLRAWGQTVEGLGFDLLMLSDHVSVTSDVAAQYPAPFYEPFTTLAWLAGSTTGIQLGTTVLVLPYRHPLLTARMAANLHDLSGGRFVLGVGVGWARQEYAALGVPFENRGALTDEYLHTITTVWRDEADYRATRIPIWVGGNSAAAIRRAVRFGAAWHPLRFRLDWFAEQVGKLDGVPLAPRIALRLTDKPLDDRLAGEGTIDQVVGDLQRLRELGARAVVLDPFCGDPDETRRPEVAWRALATVGAAFIEGDN
ncbi:LLM class flavin-dependent oxidoreductase [Fodinicola acaciae]|uniref:LLM class flavin-dependent oxidoreductase n=1 Tax=Fodinicola acaciae TaxID=2681555 RepID=UPI0013D56EAE|nr:LLM class flavin-dependent oxidoreductase [Fodinicola acaciae]